VKVVLFAGTTNAGLFIFYSCGFYPRLLAERV
jgi:hypothetical protein